MRHHIGWIAILFLGALASAQSNKLKVYIAADMPLPAVFALVGWIGVFITPGLQPGGWKYMVYAFGTILAGMAAYLILAWHKRDWPFAPSRPEAPTGPALEPGELSEGRVQIWKRRFTSRAALSI